MLDYVILDAHCIITHSVTLVPALHTVPISHMTSETRIQTLVNFEKVELFTGRRTDCVHSSFKHLKLFQTETIRASAHALLPWLPNNEKDEETAAFSR